MNYENILIKNIRKNLDKNKISWILIYDFKKVKENQNKIRNFYRKIKDLECFERKTDSELIFSKLEKAIKIKEMVEEHGGKTTLYGGLEISEECQ